jgi:hypothetical protein
VRTLLISVVLAVIPLIGIALLIVYSGVRNPLSPTVDVLFTSIMLLLMAAIFGMNALMELRAMRQSGMSFSQAMRGQTAGPTRVRTASGKEIAAVAASGLIEDLRFFEAHVGEPDKSVVMLRPDGEKSARMIVFAGNLRDQLPVGRRVELVYRPDEGACELLTRRLG